MKYVRSRKVLPGLFLMLFVLTAAGTAAYLISQSFRRNALTVGENTIRIEESFEPPEEQEPGWNPYEKQVRIRNTGPVPCFVRVFLAFSELEAENCSELLGADGEWVSFSEYPLHLPEGWIWVEESEEEVLGGYYYYEEALACEEETEALTEAIRSYYEEGEEPPAYEVLVYAESVQSRDSSGQEFGGEAAWRSAWREFLAGKGGEG